MKATAFKNLSIYPTIKHLITSRKDGFSHESYDSLNLSYHSGDNSTMVAKNRKFVASLFSLKSDNLFIPKQCHTNNIQIITAQNKNSDLSNTDGIITNVKNICIGVLAADCVPILLYDKKLGIIGALHAGWRGTTSLIQERAIHLLVNNFGSSLENILVGIGPGISQDRYEVDLDLVVEFEKSFSNTNEFIKIDKDKAFIDLAKANHAKLSEIGIPKKNIEINKLCTYNNPKLFFSARRDGFHSGRFGSFIMLKKSPPVR